jgi:hypothetical protein
VSLAALQNLVSDGPNDFAGRARRHNDRHLREAMAKSVRSQDGIQERLRPIALAIGSEC